MRDRCFCSGHATSGAPRYGLDGRMAGSPHGWLMKTFSAARAAPIISCGAVLCPPGAASHSHAPRLRSGATGAMDDGYARAVSCAPYTIHTSRMYSTRARIGIAALHDFLFAWHVCDVRRSIRVYNAYALPPTTPQRRLRPRFTLRYAPLCIPVTPWLQMHPFVHEYTWRTGLIRRAPRRASPRGAPPRAWARAAPNGKSVTPALRGGNDAHALGPERIHCAGGSGGPPSSVVRMWGAKGVRVARSARSGAGAPPRPSASHRRHPRRLSWIERA